VVSSVSGNVGSFWLLASFSRSRFRLNEDSVGKVLLSVLGGDPSLFSVVEVEDRIFKFAIFDRQVGLHVYALGSSACEAFKVFFHLWNSSGVERAKISRTSDQGPCYEWQPAKTPRRSS
jgi:hypothetical protein